MGLREGNHEKSERGWAVDLQDHGVHGVEF